MIGDDPAAKRSKAMTSQDHTYSRQKSSTDNSADQEVFMETSQDQVQTGLSQSANTKVQEVIGLTPKVNTNEQEQIGLTPKYGGKTTIQEITEDGKDQIPWSDTTGTVSKSESLTGGVETKGKLGSHILELADDASRGGTETNIAVPGHLDHQSKSSDSASNLSSKKGGMIKQESFGFVVKDEKSGSTAVESSFESIQEDKMSFDLNMDVSDTIATPDKLQETVEPPEKLHETMEISQEGETLETANADNSVASSGDEIQCEVELKTVDSSVSSRRSVPLL